MNISQLVKALEQARAEHGDLPVVAMIAKWGDGLGEIDSVELEADDDFPDGCIELS